MRASSNANSGGGSSAPAGSTLSAPAGSLIAGYLELAGQVLLTASYPDLQAAFWTELSTKASVQGNVSYGTGNTGNYNPAITADSKLVWPAGAADPGGIYGNAYPHVAWTSDGTTLNIQIVYAGATGTNMCAVGYDLANTRWGGRISNGAFVRKSGAINASWSTATPTNHGSNSAYPQLALSNGYWFGDGASGTNLVRLLRSTDLNTFTDVTKSGLSGFGTILVQRIVALSGVLLVLFQGNTTGNPWGMLKSTDDGATWTEVTSSITAILNGLGLSNSSVWLDVVDGKFYLRTYISALNTGYLYEGDAAGTTWTKKLTVANNNMISMVKANGVIVAGGGAGLMASPDLIRSRKASLVSSSGHPTYVIEPRYGVLANEVYTIGYYSNSLYLMKLPMYDVDPTTQFQLPNTPGTYAKAAA